VLAMAFSHINVETSVTPPWRGQSCACESEKQTKRSSGDDRPHFVPMRGRLGDDERATSGRGSR
jgi:hypothetical protein